MRKTYFTFDGSQEQPYGKDEYIITVGRDTWDCMDTFRKKYPDLPDDRPHLNCKTFYDEGDWPEVYNERYKGMLPKETIFSDTAYGKKPDGFAPLWIFVPSEDALIYMEGSASCDEPLESDGSNLDRIDYHIFGIADGTEISEYGEIDRTGYSFFQLIDYGIETCKCLADAIPWLLSDAFGSYALDAQILEKTHA